jgi:hypothetical protein
MEDFKKIILFIAIVFVILVSLSLLAKSQEGVLVPYRPHQTIRPTTNNDTELYYDTLSESYRHVPINRGYVLITMSEDGGWATLPIYKTVDYGTYHEIDSLKCVRYKQMQWKMYYLDKLNEKDCN